VARQVDAAGKRRRRQGQALPQRESWKRGNRPSRQRLLPARGLARAAPRFQPPFRLVHQAAAVA
jgi:hypothetical protein